jgi:hypothetical protein
MKNLQFACILLILLVSCQNRPELAGVPITDYYNRCPEKDYDFGETITIGDPNDKFMITLPYEWEIQETYSDTLYGMIADNSTIIGEDPLNFVMISVMGYQTQDSLFEYFRKEVADLKKDKTMKVLEAGKVDFNGTDSYWLKFETTEQEHTILNVVKYIKSATRNEIYLIQSSVNKTGNYDEKICILKKLADSFELVGEE